MVGKDGRGGNGVDSEATGTSRAVDSCTVFGVQGVLTEACPLGVAASLKLVVVGLVGGFEFSCVEVCEAPATEEDNDDRLLSTESELSESPLAHELVRFRPPYM